jgi:tetratricopeptide (TPR) repeat protein
MAIEKIQGAPKVEWTRTTLLQLAGAGGLTVLSLLLVWFAFSNWRFKENVTEGYQAYDRGRPKAAKGALESALGWRPKDAGSRELLAKILCDEGKLDEALKHYAFLAGSGFTGPQVHIGMGVISLKEAQALDAPKAAEAKVAEAAAEFGKSAGVPEAEIGRGQCELLLAYKLHDPSHEAKAAAIFGKVRTAMQQSRDFRAGITRDGLIDYYAGLGKALASGERPDEGAREAFRACSQYTGPTWPLPMANVLSLEARRLAQFSGGGDVLQKMQGELNTLRNQTAVQWRAIKSPEEREELREPWVMFSLALAQAWGRAGNANEMSNITRDLQTSSGLEQRLDPQVMEAQMRTEQALREDVSPSAQESAVTRAVAAYTELLQHVPSDEAHKELRARAINNIAWALAWRGGYSSNDNLFVQAQQKLSESLRLFPDDYAYNRNMAIILKRLKRPPTSPQGFLDKCRSAAAKDKDLALDFEKVEKYMEAK